MNKLKQWMMKMARGVLCLALGVAGAWVAQAEGYLEPVFNSSGAVSGYVHKEFSDGYSAMGGGQVVNGDKTLKQKDNQWYIISGGWTITGKLKIEGDVKIVLGNYQYLKAGRIEVKGDNKLTIYGQSTNEDEMGTLTITGPGNGCAGIGGNKGSANGAITINGGKLTVKGGENASGIGGGNQDKGKNITINGGFITVTGGPYGAGIGGGFNDDCDGVTINGGTVTATGGANAAGIGGGAAGKGKNITINGGTVTAIGDEKAAGIGGGWNDKGQNITINGGTVTARGGECAAGIGSGDDSGSENITINGGTVKAYGGQKGGAGIGGGRKGQVQGVKITGGKVLAVAGGSYDPTVDKDPTNSWTDKNIEEDGDISRGMDIGAGGIKASTVTSADVEVGVVKLMLKFIPKNMAVRVAELGLKFVGHVIKYIRKNQDFSCTKDIRIEGGTVVAMLIGGDLEKDAEEYQKKQVVVTGGSLLSVGSSQGIYDDSGNELYCVAFAENVSSPASILIPGYGTKDLYPRTEGNQKTLYLWLPDGWSKQIKLNGYIYRGFLHRMRVAVVNKGTDNEDVFYALSNVTVNNKNVTELSGDGWAYDPSTCVLTLSKAMNYTVSGTDDGRSRIEVTANANVTLDNLTLPHTKQNVWPIQFTAGTTNSLILTGANTVYGQGTYAAVFVGSGAMVTVSGTGELVGNHADSDSRGFHVDGTLVMNGGTICDYSISAGGGGVAISNGGAFTMNGGTISGCSTRCNSGGAIYNGGAFTMNGGTINGCSALNYGGAIYNEGTLTITGGTIKGCSASKNGGALFNDGTADIYGGTFTDNSASSGYGGFCYCNDDKSVSIYGGYFSGNTAPSGRCNLYHGYGWQHNGQLFGGVFAADPTAYDESDGWGGCCLVPQTIEQGTVAVTKVGDSYVVGAGVQAHNGQLTAGTYTFDPENSEYADAGVTVMSVCTVTEQTTTPKTFVITPPDANFSVNGTRVIDGPGRGWSFDYEKNTLVLSNDMTYVLSGYCNESYTVDVTANAHITLLDARIHAGDLEPYQVFDIKGSDVTLTLCGSNEVYTSSEYYRAAFAIEEGAKLTMNGDGALYGGKSCGGSAICVQIWSGTFIFDSGTICDYYGSAIGNYYGYFEMNGGVVKNCYSPTGAFLSNTAGTSIIKGGSVFDCTSGNAAYIRLNKGTCTIYGGYFGNSDYTKYFSTDDDGTITVYGAVVDNTNTSVQDGYRVEDFKAEGTVCMTVGNNKVIGKGVTAENGLLTGGTYTFNPRGDEYAAAGLVCSPYHTVIPQGTEPETYTIQHMDEFKINGTRLLEGPGEGWSFALDGTKGYLTLSNAMDYVLTGYADFKFTIDVLENATVTLDGVRIKSDKPARDIFRVFGTNTTFVLSGTNTVYANDGNAAIGVTAGAKLTVESVEGVEKVEGVLVGGRTSGVNGRGFSVYGELVLESGTIRDYYAGGGGGVFCDGGTFTMNGGEIAGCSSYLTGSGSSIFGGGIFFNNNANGNLNGGTISGCSAMYGSAFASMWATVNVRSGFVVSNNVATGHGTCFAQRAKINIWGGTYRNNRSNSGVFVSSYHASTVNVYGGVVTDNTGLIFKKNETSVLNVHGGVYSSEPDAEWIVSGSEAEQVGDLWVVGADVQSDAGELSAGTYTFDPQEDEYVAVGLGIADRRIVTAQGTEPETYVVDWNKTGFTVDGTDVVVGSGTGWSFDETTGLVTINDVNQHVLSGQNTRGEFDLHVTIDAAASVILSNVTIATTANVPLTANAEGVKVLLAGENTLTAPDQKAGLACPEGKDVTIDLADADADDASAVLNVQGGYYSSAIGNNWYQKTGAITIAGGTINATAGFDGTAIGSARDAGCEGVTINGGIVRATANGNAAAIGAGFRTSCDFVRITGGRVTTTSSGDQIGIGYRRDSHNWSSCPTVTIKGGTVVAETIKASNSITINGGSVKAVCTPNPITTYEDFNGQTVWCVTFPDVTNAVTALEFTNPSYSYGCNDVYPINSEVYVWLPNYANSYKMAVNGQCEKEEYYYADVYNAPTIAYHKDSSTIKLYVNEVQVGLDGGTGWTYNGSVLTLNPSDVTTNSYAITGMEMNGRVRIVVAGGCDLSFTGQLGYDPENDESTHDHLITINEDVAVNLTFSDAAAFSPYTDYEPVCVKSGATANILGSGLVYGFNVKIEGTGKITMEDPTTLTYTTKAGADKAAATIQPLANEENFPGIDQAAYATRVKAVVVERTGTDTWTLDYQISEQGTNDILNVISSVEANSNLVANIITNGTPAAKFYPIPGFYYGMPGATEVGDVKDATVPFWYSGQQDEEITVEGQTFTDTDKAFYQIRATLNP